MNVYTALKNKKQILFLLTLLSLPTFVLAQQDKQDIWIDKFDQASYRNLLNGYWETYNDQRDSGASHIAISYWNDPVRKNQALGFSYTLQKAKLKWDPYVAMSCSCSVRQIDIDSVLGIAYEFKGNAHSFLYRGNAVNDYAYFQKTIPGSEGWTTVVVPYTDLHQPKWGKKVTFDKYDLHSLAWQISGKSNDSGNVYIDNVRFIKTIDESLLTEEQRNNRASRQAEEKKQHQFVQELLYTVDDSLLETIGEDGAQLLKYRTAMQKVKVYDTRIDSLLAVVKKSSLSEQEKESFNSLIHLAKNTVSGDAYQQARTYNSERLLVFNKVIPLYFLYDLEKEYVKQLRSAEAIRRWVMEVYEYSSVDEMETVGFLAPDSVVLAELKLYAFKKNDVVAEIGAGAGYFEQKLSKYCDDLTVYVNELDSALAAKLKTKLVFLQLQDKKNISYAAVRGSEKNSGLPAGKFDKIITKNAFHHFKYPNEMLQDFRKSLKQGGKLFIVDTMRDEIAVPWCAELIPRKQFMEYLTGNGFVLVKETLVGNKDHYKCFEFQVGR